MDSEHGQQKPGRWVDAGPLEARELLARDGRALALGVSDDDDPCVLVGEEAAEGAPIACHGDHVLEAFADLGARVDDAEDPLETLRVSWAVQGEPAPLVEDLAPTSNGEALSFHDPLDGHLDARRDRHRLLGPDGAGHRVRRCRAPDQASRVRQVHSPYDEGARA